MLRILNHTAACGLLSAVFALANISQGNAKPAVLHPLQAPRAPAVGGVQGEGGSGGVPKECKPLMNHGQCVALCQTSAGFAHANHQGSDFDMSKCIADCSSKCK